jgi:CheY-like chemotaxis protein
VSREPLILVVDDDPDSRTMLETMLTFAGYRVVSAENGLQALSIAERQHPSVILLDLMMPVMDGFGFRAAQLARPAIAGIPVICVSGRHDAHQAARRLGTSACVMKPFALDEIVRHVGRLTGRRTQES